MKLLEEFWYGNIGPTEYDTSSKEYKKLQELICWNEEKLRAAMTDEQKKIIREVHRLCAGVSNHYGLPDLPKQL